MRLLEGKVAAVTGGGSGYGRAVASMFARQGAKVAVLDIKNEPVDGFEEEDYSLPTAEALRKEGLVAEYIYCDVSDPVSVENAFKEIDEKLGTVDILCNSAGIWRGGVPIDEQKGDWLRKIMQVNLFGSFYCSKEALKRMKEKKWGRIVQIASTAAFLATAYEDNYDMSKGAVSMLVKSIAAEYGEYNITCNSVCPATGYTPMTKHFMKHPGYFESLKASCTIHELVWPKDVAAYATFFASDFASCITGTEGIIDGGRRACGGGHSKNMRGLFTAAGMTEFFTNPQ